VFTDAHNNEIFSLKNKHFTLHKSFHAEDPHGHDLFVVKGAFSCEWNSPMLYDLPFSPKRKIPSRTHAKRICIHPYLLFVQRLSLRLPLEPATNDNQVLTSKSTVTFKNASDGHDVELDVRGSWFDRSASITFGGQPVAHISRSFFNVREIFADKDTVSEQGSQPWVGT